MQGVPGWSGRALAGAPKSSSRRGAFRALLLAACVASACTDSTAPNDDDDACDTTLPIVIGTTVNGSLASGDCQLGDESFADRYVLTVSTSTQVQINLSSAVFDSFLLLFSSPNTFITDDDDSGGGENARITRTLTPGSYIIMANSLDAGETGAYQLSVTVITP